MSIIKLKKCLKVVRHKPHFMQSGWTLNIIKSMKRSNVIKDGEWFCVVAAGR